MMEKVRYERRIFTHFPNLVGDQPIFYLLDTLEKVIVDLGAFPGIDRCYDSDFHRDGVITGEKRDYLVSKKNGAHSLVTLEARVNSGSSNFIKAFVVNVEKYEHKELLAALHTFYDGKLGYKGMPEPEIVEREVKLQ